jgi:hypothetical protein
MEDRVEALSGMASSSNHGRIRALFPHGKGLVVCSLESFFFA